MMKRSKLNFLVYLLLSGCLFSTSVFAQPTFSEANWSLVKTVDLNNATSVAFNDFDNNVYVATRTNGGIISRWETDGSLTMVANESNVAGIAFDPTDGDLFVGLDFPGQVIRYDHNGGDFGTREVWVSGFGPSDDDTAGIAYVPSTYTGGLATPGSFLNVDRDNSSNDSIFAWSATAAEGEVEIYNDSITIDIVSALATNTSIFVADWDASSSSGGIFELVDDGVGGLTLSQIPVTGDLFVDPSAMTMDELTMEMVVRGQNLAGGESLYRVDLTTGVSTEIASGLDPTLWNSLAMDGDDIYFSSGDQVFHFARVPEPGSSLIVLVASAGLAMRRKRV